MFVFYRTAESLSSPVVMWSLVGDSLCDNSIVPHGDTIVKSCLGIANTSDT